MRRGVVKATLALAAIAAVGAGLALTGAGATPSVGQQGPVVTHLPKITPSVYHGSVRDLPQLSATTHEHPKPRKWEPDDLVPVAPKTALPDATPAQEAPTVPSAPAPAPGASFAGLDKANWGDGWPPDTNGDVGPTYFVQAVNTSIGIFRKSDGARVSAFTFDSLWSNAHSGTTCDTSNGGDPTVVYDPIGDRWIVADFSFTGSGNSPPYYECIAVSQTGDPASDGWYFYAVRADDASHPWFPDYPKMGIWPDGLYMTANMFQGASTYREVRVWAFNRNDLESGAPLRSVVMDTNSASYFSLLPGNMRTAAGAPPPGAPNYLVSESQSSWAFEVWKFHVDYSGSGSTFTGPFNVSQATYNGSSGTVPSPGNSLDSLFDRLMNSAQYSNIGGRESLWVNHTVRCCGTSSSPMGIQWAQLNVTGGAVATTPVQQQVYPGRERRPRPLDGQRRGRQARGHGARLQRFELDADARHPLRRPPRRRSARHASADRDEHASGRNARHADEHLRRRNVPPLGRLQRDDARSERLRLLVHAGVLRRERREHRELADAHRQVPPRPELRDGRRWFAAADDHVRPACGQDVRRYGFHGERDRVVGTARVLRGGRQLHGRR